MKQLQKEFTGIGEVRGFSFSQIKCNNSCFMYEVSSDGGTHYEVFEKRVNKRYGNISYPKSKSFGKWAFTTKERSRADELFDEITERVRQRLKKKALDFLSKQAQDLNLGYGD